MTLAEQDIPPEERRGAHILRLVPKQDKPAPRSNAPEKFFAAVQAACEAGGLQLSEAAISLVPLDHRAVANPVEASAGDDADETAIFAVLEIDETPLALVETDPQTLFMVVSALLGADPESEPEAIGRPLSSAERGFLSIVADDIATLLAAAGIEEARNCASDLLHKEPDDGLLGALSPGMRLTLALNWGEQSGSLAVTLARKLVEDRFADAPEPVAPSPAAASWGARLKHSVGKAPVRLSAVLPMGTRTLGQIRHLRVGDTIDLASLGAAQSIHLVANGHTLFTAELGKIGKAYSARITARHTHPAKAGETSLAD